MALTFDALRDANASRVLRWHDPESSSWTIADWSNAMCGEAGELANVIKKIRRQEDGARGVDDPDLPSLRAMAADEMADVICYLDLLAHEMSIDLDDAVASKFNRVSDRQGFPEKLDVEAPIPIEMHDRVTFFGRVFEVRERNAMRIGLEEVDG